jgi:hypothetical protein
MGYGTYSLVDIYKRFRGTCCLHLQDRRLNCMVKTVSDIWNGGH